MNLSASINLIMNESINLQVIKDIPGAAQASRIESFGADHHSIFLLQRAVDAEIRQIDCRVLLRTLSSRSTTDHGSSATIGAVSFLLGVQLDFEAKAYYAVTSDARFCMEGAETCEKNYKPPPKTDPSRLPLFNKRMLMCCDVIYQAEELIKVRYERTLRHSFRGNSRKREFIGDKCKKYGDATTCLDILKSVPGAANAKDLVALANAMIPVSILQNKETFCNVTDLLNVTKQTILLSNYKACSEQSNVDYACREHHFYLESRYYAGLGYSFDHYGLAADCQNVLACGIPANVAPAP
ncbi:hypothetical protein CRG98_016940 [Punica granatum]|uniref:Pectinesterase inhibitor domain-containing protein n=1 Tax=Punica granatum TaxID=22663 RepID=A0A2I0K293_PUNGR|nr:hypothetical protein CRG98_016940 [Punica granatum]